MDIKMFRSLFDMVAVVAAISTLVTSGAMGWDVDQGTGARFPVLLISMEFITLAFHLFYIVDLLTFQWAVKLGEPNRLKWVEYACTATLGTLAVLTKGQPSARTDEMNALIVIVAILGGTQQLQGDLLERDPLALMYGMATGVVLQAAEFVAVFMVAGTNATVVVYVVFYSMFGALAYLSSTAQDPSRWANVDYVESLYSVLGWVTKTLLFWVYTGVTDLAVGMLVTGGVLVLIGFERASDKYLLR